MKTIKLLLIISLCFILAGCNSISENEGNNINKALIKKGIIGNGYKQVEKIEYHYQSFSGGPGSRDNYFIYKDDNNHIMAVTYAKSYDDIIAYVYSDIIEYPAKEIECENKDLLYISNNEEKCYATRKYSFVFARPTDRISSSNSKLTKYKINKKGFIFHSYEVEELDQ